MDQPKAHAASSQKQSNFCDMVLSGQGSAVLGDNLNGLPSDSMIWMLGVQIRDACGITIRAVESLQYSASKAVDGFAWDDRPELSQIHHSRLQLEICLPLSPNLSWYRMHQVWSLPFLLREGPSERLSMKAKYKHGIHRLERF